MAKKFWITSCIALCSFNAFTPGNCQPAQPVSGAASTPTTVVTAKSAEQQLRRMGEPIKRLKRASYDLIGECTQPVEMMGEIDIIGTDVIPIMPQTAEGFGNEFIAPRPKYVNLHMQQLGALVPILQGDIESLAIPSEEKDYATPLLSDLGNYMQDIRQHYKNLQALTAGTDYNQVQIVNEAKAVDDSLKSIDNSRKKLLHEDIRAEKTEDKASKNQK